MEALLNSSVVELVIVRMIWKYSNTVRLANIVTDDSKQEYYAKIARKLADSKNYWTISIPFSSILKKRFNT